MNSVTFTGPSRYLNGRFFLAQFTFDAKDNGLFLSKISSQLPKKLDMIKKFLLAKAQRYTQYFTTSAKTLN